MYKVLLVLACLAAGASAAAAQTPTVARFDQRAPRQALVITATSPDLLAVAAPQPTQRRSVSVWRKLAFGAIGGFAGFYGGGIIGARIEGNRCRCDDPGLKGALIGAPIGAVVGATLGVVLASK
jgi:hypothetical protein